MSEVEGGRGGEWGGAGGKSSDCTSGEITVCSAETTLFLAPAATESTTQPHIHIHHALQNQSPSIDNAKHLLFARR